MASRYLQAIPWRLLMGLAVVSLLLWKLLPADWSSHFDASMLIAAMAIQPVAMMGLVPHATRLGILAGLPASRLGHPLAALLLAQGLNLLLPGRVAEFLKASYLHSHAGVPVSQGIAAVFLERSVDLVIVAGLSLVSLALFATGTITWAWLAAGALLLGLMLVPAQEERLARLVSRLPWPMAAAFAERFCRHVSHTVREQVFSRAMALGIVTWIFSLLNVYVFIQIAGSHPVDAKGALGLFVATTIGGALPGLPGGFGAYEAGAVLALRPYGYDTGEALAIGLALHLSQFVIPLLATGAILARDHIGLSQLLRRLRQEFAAQKEAGNENGNI